MHYGNIKKLAVEDGIGCRTAFFVSGCRHHCKGCFQPETWNFDYGQPYTKETEKEILDSLRPDYVAGITILGGEPFEPENQSDILSLIKAIKKQYPDKTIWIYSGCTFEDLMDTSSQYHTDNTVPILEQTDILVDGEFIQEKKNLMLRFRGSENQRIIDVQKSLETQTPVLSEYYDRHSTKNT